MANEPRQQAAVLVAPTWWNVYRAPHFPGDANQLAFGKSGPWRARTLHVMVNAVVMKSVDGKLRDDVLKESWTKSMPTP
jgi:predicted P-loop ATPase/GTPase